MKMFKSNEKKSEIKTVYIKEYTTVKKYIKKNN